MFESFLLKGPLVLLYIKRFTSYFLFYAFSWIPSTLRGYPSSIAASLKVRPFLFVRVVVFGGECGEW